MLRMRGAGVVGAGHDGRPGPVRRRCAPRRSARGRRRAPTSSSAEGSDTVRYWLRRCTRGDSVDSTHQPIRADEATRDRPLLAVAVMHQHRDRRARGPRGEEGYPVLGVDHRVGAHAAQRTETEPTGHDGGQRAGVDGEAPAGATDRRCRRSVSRCAERPDNAAVRRVTLMPRAASCGADLLQIPLAAATLWVPGVTPAEQQNLAHGRGSQSVRRKTNVGPHTSGCALRNTDGSTVSAQTARSTPTPHRPHPLTRTKPHPVHTPRTKPTHPTHPPPTAPTQPRQTPPRSHRPTQTHKPNPPTTSRDRRVCP